MSLAPAWLDTLSRLTPFRHVTDALRAAFAGHYAAAPVVSGVLVTVLLTVTSVAVGTRTLLRENA